MAGVLTNGRNKPGKGEKHVRLTRFFLKTEAWRDLSTDARALYIVLKDIYNGQNNGYLFLSARDAAERINRHRDTACKAFHDLEDHGFIKARQKGSFSYKKRHATEWILTEYEFNGQHETKDYVQWRPVEKEKAGPKKPDRQADHLGPMAS
jgi:hypothetical protein